MKLHIFTFLHALEAEIITVTLVPLLCSELFLFLTQYHGVHNTMTASSYSRKLNQVCLIMGIWL